MLLSYHCFKKMKLGQNILIGDKNVENKYLNISTKIPIFISCLKSTFWQAIEN